MPIHHNKDKNTPSFDPPKPHYAHHLTYFWANCGELCNFAKIKSYSDD